jgi:hypothetical protein
MSKNKIMTTRVGRTRRKEEKEETGKEVITKGRDTCDGEKDDRTELEELRILTNAHEKDFFLQISTSEMHNADVP